MKHVTQSRGEPGDPLQQNEFNAEDMLGSTEVTPKPKGAARLRKMSVRAKAWMGGDSAPAPDEDDLCAPEPI